MRRVFSSPRLENVEGVADLLRGEGIEVRITDGRSYKGNRRGTFKYSEPSAAPQAAVWVVKSEDQPRARALLREAGLLETTRPGPDGAPGAAVPPGAPVAGHQRLAMRLRIVLLGAIVLIAIFQFLR